MAKLSLEETQARIADLEEQLGRLDEACSEVYAEAGSSAVFSGYDEDFAYAAADLAIERFAEPRRLLNEELYALQGPLPKMPESLSELLTIAVNDADVPF